MSLNASQMDATRRELQANFERSGLSAEAVAARLGVGAADVDTTLQMRHPDPVLVWAVRNVLETAVREAGAEPVPYTSLTEANRANAERLFGIVDHR